MKFSIAQIGQNRLKRVLIEDKQNSPQKVCEVLKSDFLKIVECYLENSNIDIDSMQCEDGIIFNVKIKCSRTKSFGVLS